MSNQYYNRSVTLDVSGLRIENRADGRSNRPVIAGVAVVIDSLSVDLGGFKERITREAIEYALRHSDEVLCYLEHDERKLLARQGNGTLGLSVSARGLECVIFPADTTAGRDAVELVRRGDIRGMSFKFRSPDGWWRVTRQDGEIVRVVEKMIISEVSLVARPAYKATSAELRAILSKAPAPTLADRRAMVERWERETRESNLKPYREKVQQWEKDHVMALIRREAISQGGGSDTLETFGWSQGATKDHVWPFNPMENKPAMIKTRWNPATRQVESIELWSKDGKYHDANGRVFSREEVASADFLDRYYSE